MGGEDYETTVVAALPRRTAHALHALLTCNNDGIPSIASEIVIYDSEARSSKATAAALREASQRGYCVCANGVWFTTPAAYELRPALEARFLADTDDDLPNPPKVGGGSGHEKPERTGA